jgi:prepilin-type N-terminal cleavage/methylation domain-containing protein
MSDRINRNTRGFTLVELLVVIGIIALLVSMLLPSLRKAQASAERVKCMSNQRQLTTAVRMYAADNKDVIPVSWPDSNGSVKIRTTPWVIGGNTLNAITSGSIHKYARNPEVYHCPGDFTWHRISYAMNFVLNGESFGPRYGKLSQVKGQSQTMAFIDENDVRGDYANGYNLGSFAVSSYPFENNSVWVDNPGQWHDRGAVVSFIDSHVEWFRWNDPRTVKLQITGSNGQSTPNNKDLTALQKATYGGRMRLDEAPPQNTW